MDPQGIIVRSSTCSISTEHISENRILTQNDIDILELYENRLLNKIGGALWLELRKVYTKYMVKYNMPRLPTYSNKLTRYAKYKAPLSTKFILYHIMIAKIPLKKIFNSINHCVLFPNYGSPNEFRIPFNEKNYGLKTTYLDTYGYYTHEIVPLVQYDETLYSLLRESPIYNRLILLWIKAGIPSHDDITIIPQKDMNQLNIDPSDEPTELLSKFLKNTTEYHYKIYLAMDSEKAYEDLINILQLNDDVISYAINQKIIEYQYRKCGITEFILNEFAQTPRGMIYTVKDLEFDLSQITRPDSKHHIMNWLKFKASKNKINFDDNRPHSDLEDFLSSGIIDPDLINTTLHALGQSNIFRRNELLSIPYDQLSVYGLPKQTLYIIKDLIHFEKTGIVKYSAGQ